MSSFLYRIGKNSCKFIIRNHSNSYIPYRSEWYGEVEEPKASLDEWYDNGEAAWPDIKAEGSSHEIAQPAASVTASGRSFGRRDFISFGAVVFFAIMASLLLILSAAVVVFILFLMPLLLSAAASFTSVVVYSNAIVKAGLLERLNAMEAHKLGKTTRLDVSGEKSLNKSEKHRTCDTDTWRPPVTMCVS